MDMYCESMSISLSSLEKRRANASSTKRKSSGHSVDSRAPIKGARRALHGKSMSGVLGEQHVACAASCKENEIISDPRIGLQAREFGLVDSLYDR
jgi:hypothetical protein